MTATVDQTLRHLLLIRLVVIGGQLLALVVMHRAFGVAVPWAGVGLVLAPLAAFTAWSWRRLSVARGGQRQALLQSLVDIAALSALIHLTGGAVNPFVSLFLLPIVFAAAAMPLAYLAGIATVAIAAYTGLMLFSLPEPTHVHAVAGRFDLHVWGMWYGFILSAACVGLFVARLSRRLRARDRELAVLREEALAAERVMALGALAAGTAHELGTPLATIGLAAEELEQEVTTPAAQAQLTRLREQVRRCREILTRISAAAGATPAAGGRVVALDAYLDQLIAEWRQRRPEVRLAFRRDGSAPPPAILADRVITQAIVNVLDNAAEAQAREVAVVARWDANELCLEIDDDGVGIANELAPRLGREAVSTKREGMGIGLLLSRAILERLGGVLALDRGEPRGTRAHIRLPLAALTVA